MDATFRTVNEALVGLSYTLEQAGTEVASRGGRVKELIQSTVTLTNPWRREILIPERRASLVAQITETMWVLGGNQAIGMIEPYLPRAAEFSDDGATWRAAYGSRLRCWPTFGAPYLYGADQLANVVNLLKQDNMTRQAVISIWDPARDFEKSKDIPCNNWLHFLNRNGALYMSVATRSNDLIWGWSGINQFEWSALQEIMASILGLGVGPIHYTIGSLHAYERHWGRMAKIAESNPMTEQFLETGPEPTFRSVDELDHEIRRWWEAEKILREHSAPAKEAIARVSDPMFKAWIQVIAAYHQGAGRVLAGLEGTTIHQAALLTKGIGR